MNAPAYSFARGRFGKRNRTKLHRLDVRDIRKWATREGFGLSLSEQVRIVHERYGPNLSPRTFLDILTNRTWAEWGFNRETPDPEWADLPVSTVALLVLRRPYRPRRRKAS